MAEGSDTLHSDEKKLARVSADRLKRGFVYLIGLVVLLVFAVPYIWMFASSFKTTARHIQRHEPVLDLDALPRTPTTDNFVRLWTDKGIGRYLLNTLVIAAAQIGLTLVVCSLAGSLSASSTSGAAVFFVLILVSFMIPSRRS